MAAGRGTRLVILNIIFENFKSYPKFVEFGPFHKQRDRLADGGGHETRQHRKPSDMACSEGARREKALTLKRLKSGYVGQLTKRYNEVQNIMERSCDNSAIDVILKIKDKILVTFEVYKECHAEHVEFLVDDKEKDDAQKAYRVECDTRQKMDQMVNSLIAKIKGKYKELPQIEANDSISHVSSKASTTASKMKLRAKAKHTVALLKLKQLEEQQALQDIIDEVEITMKLDEAMKLNKMKRKQAFLDARHEVQIRNAEYEVYERSKFRNENLETLNNDETLENESPVKELQTKRNIDSYVKKSSTNPELHHEVKSREKTELHEYTMRRNTICWNCKDSMEYHNDIMAIPSIILNLLTMRRNMIYWNRKDSIE
ncbi:hypothetical protein AC249_AIPGENE13882 [Exaiptasia diaphana]|nr:hypothetical protein AC249_AIPGENE13882 [Exaiptasia diaphana]